MCGKVLPTGGARSANFQFSLLIKSWRPRTHRYTHTHTRTHSQVNAFVLGKENKGQHLASTRQLQAETRKLPQFNLAKRRKHEKCWEEGRRGCGVRAGGWGLGASAGVANYAKYLYASKARKIFAIYLSHVPHSPSKQKRWARRAKQGVEGGREGGAGLRERQAASLATCSSSCHLPDLIWNSKWLTD